MSSKVKPIPDGYHSITPYLCAKDAASALDFYKKAFGATEVMCMRSPDGKVMHAELMLGDSKIMLAEECPGMQFLSPQTVGGSPVMIHFYCDDVDAVVRQAEAAGAKVDRPPETKFYGDRGASLVDPFGHIWHVSTHVEDVAPDEMERRAAKLHGAG